MFVESLEALPETLRADFVESEFNGKKGFQHKDTIALANSLKNAKAERDQYKTKANEFEAQMSAQEAQTAAKIEAAKAKALEEARSSGDVAAIEKRYQEQMADLEKRTAERVRNEVTGEFSLKIAKEKTESLINELSAKYAVDEHAIKPLRRYMADFISIDENGKQVFLDENGGATSLDSSGFEKEFFSSANVSHLVKGSPTTTGGGLAKGNTGAGGASTVNTKAQEAKKKGDLAGFLQASLQNT